MYTMDVQEYNEKVMNGYFKKIYPVIASQIVDKTHVTQGECIDLGGGPGMLGISMAKITNLHITVYDLLKECVDLVSENSSKNGVSNRVDALQGMAECMDCFKDNSIDLVISRGSIFFWENVEKGISEVYRVLKPDGWAYIGGGFGSVELKNEIMEKRNSDPGFKMKDRMREHASECFEDVLTELKIDGYVDKSEAGTWIIFQKKNEVGYECKN